VSDCRHRCVAEYLGPKMRRPIPANHRPGHGAAWHPGVFKLVCVTCGELMPLGPANDTPAVRVEIRAAALAQATREEDYGREDETWTEEEGDGWNRHQYDWPTMGDAERAGWLAREIWTHEQETP